MARRKMDRKVAHKIAGGVQTAGSKKKKQKVQYAPGGRGPEVQRNIQKYAMEHGCSIREAKKRLRLKH